MKLRYFLALLVIMSIGASFWASSYQLSYQHIAVASMTVVLGLTTLVNVRNQTKFEKLAYLYFLSAITFTGYLSMYFEVLALAFVSVPATIGSLITIIRGAMIRGAITSEKTTHKAPSVKITNDKADKEEETEEIVKSAKTSATPKKRRGRPKKKSAQSTQKTESEEKSEETASEVKKAPKKRKYRKKKAQEPTVTEPETEPEN